MVVSPTRRESRNEFLDPSLLCLEKALRARISVIGSHRGIARRCVRMHGMTDEPMTSVLADVVCEIIATELRDLAEELHYW